MALCHIILSAVSSAFCHSKWLGLAWLGSDIEIESDLFAVWIESDSSRLHRIGNRL